MGLVQCQDCGNWVSDRATACPSCGCPTSVFQDSSDYQDNGNSGGGILNGIIRTAVGVAIGNRLSENGKKNYMDSPNCERAKTGRKTSCWGCGLGDKCTMHDKY